MNPDRLLTPRFSDALTYTLTLHATQMRKGTNVPYVAHLLGVASIVLENGGTEDEAIAALLHDAVEDQGGDVTRQEIIRRFGPNVAAIVDGCTDAEVIPKPEWEERKQKYIAHLAHASPSVRLVSSADKLYNARAILSDYRQIGEALWGRFTGKRKGTLWYYRALVTAFRKHNSNPIVDELERTVTELERVTSPPLA
jgi:GTP pyrophosphokinase